MLLRLARTSELEDMVSMGNFKIVDFLKFPCHTPSDERCDKLTIEAAGSVAGNTAREGFFLNKF